MEDKKIEYINAGIRCLKTNKNEEAIRIFSKIIEENVGDKSISKVYEYRSTSYYILKRYDESLKDAQKAMLMNPKSPNAYKRVAMSLWSLDKKQAAVKVLQNGVTVSDKSDNSYKKLQESLKRLTISIAEIKNVHNKKTIDPLDLLPFDIIIMIFSHFKLSDMYSLRGVSRKWKKYIEACDFLWRTLDFNVSPPPSIIPRSVYTSENGACCEDTFPQNQCYNLVSFGRKDIALSESSYLLGLKCAKSSLRSIIVPNGKMLTKGSIVEIFTRRRPNLETIALGRLHKLNNPQIIQPLIKYVLDTNRLKTLCLSYNVALTSVMVYELGIRCSSLKILDVSGCPNVNWVIVTAQAGKIGESKWMQNLEELYVNDQLENLVLISQYAKKKGFELPKLHTISLSWNMNRSRHYFANKNEIDFDNNPFIRGPTHLTSWDSYPNIKNVCLDGHFDYYTPGIDEGYTNRHIYGSQTPNNDNKKSPSWTVFSAAQATKLSSSIFCHWLRDSRGIRVLDLSGAVQLDNEAASLISTRSPYLISLNISGCVGFSLEDLTRIVRSTLLHQLKYLNLSNTVADNSVAFEIASNLNCCLEKLILDSTSISGVGLVAIAKAAHSLGLNTGASSSATEHSTFTALESYGTNANRTTDPVLNQTPVFGYQSATKTSNPLNKRKFLSTSSHSSSSSVSPIFGSQKNSKRLLHASPMPTGLPMEVEPLPQRDTVIDGQSYFHESIPDMTLPSISSRLKLISVNKCQNIGIDAVNAARLWLSNIDAKISYFFGKS